MKSSSRFLIFFSLILFMLSLGACAIPLRAPMPGLIYTDSKAGHSVTANLTGTRIGQACSSSVLGLVSTGDSSIEAAARNGGISLITSVDESFKSYVGLYGKHCTIVRGR